MIAMSACTDASDVMSGLERIPHIDAVNIAMERVLSRCGSTGLIMTGLPAQQLEHATVTLRKSGAGIRGHAIAIHDRTMEA